MGTQTYWLADPDGNLAPAEGAAERDRLAALGWTVADIQPTSQVWCHNAAIGGWSKFAFEVLGPWGARGWTPAAPPMEQGDVGPVVALPPPGAEPPAEPEPQTAMAEPEAKPKIESKKETDRA